MSNIVVTVIDLKTFEHLLYIRFPLDAGKNFCYRSRMSYNAFTGVKGRCYKRKETLYHCKHEYEMVGFLGKIDESLPMVTANSIWEFYKLVGYDYKKKKWSR